MRTFADAAARIAEQKRAGWGCRIHARTWLNSLERHAFPLIGSRSVSEVTSADVLGVLVGEPVQFDVQSAQNPLVLPVWHRNHH